MTLAFTQSGPTTRTRLAPSSHRDWIPIPYMERAAHFLAHHYVGGLPLKPGGRKTSITLEAFRQLREAGKVRTMLVIAPLRVCRQTWRQEAAKWSQFKDFKFALLHGPKKKDALKSGADIYLINPEGIAWLSAQYMGRALPFDIVCIDELTKFQNATAERHKALRPRLKGVPYRWGLTGSLFAKGHMSVFGQQLILDDGAALGRYITHYRDQFFQVGFDGFSYDLLPGAEKRILDRMAPYWFYMDERDYAQLPEIVDIPRIAFMDRAQRKLYDQMKNDMVAQLPEGTVTAANAGACYSKLSQMANGAMYLENHSVAAIHDLKLDMLEELVDELNGEPLLVAYEFNHDLERIRERLGKDLPYLGKGTTSRQEDLWVKQWNNGELPVLLAHPQSAGHGLNMQEGQARNVAWFSVTWDWELYDQFIRRIRRSGNENAQVFNHLLIVKDTLDEMKLSAVTAKDMTDRQLTAGLNAILLSEEQSDATTKGDIEMVAKLSRPETAQPAPGGWGAPPQAAQPQQQPQAAQPQQAAPGGWGAAVGPDPNAEQRARIQEQIAPQPDRSQDAKAAFSGSVGAAAGQIAQGDYGEMAAPGQPAQPAPATAPTGWGAQPQQQASASQQAPFDGGKPVETKTAPEPDKPISKMKKDELVEYVQQLEAAGTGSTSDGSELQIAQLRAAVLTAVVKSSPDLELADIIETSREMMDFVLRG